MKFPKIAAATSETLIAFPKAVRNAPGISKVQANLVNQAYAMYCFGYQHAAEGTLRRSRGEFCKKIKEANEQGKILAQEHI